MVGRKLKLSYNYNTENQSMLSSVLFTCRRAGDEEKQQAALWLIGEQSVVLFGTHNSRFIGPINGKFTNP